MKQKYWHFYGIVWLSLLLLIGFELLHQRVPWLRQHTKSSTWLTHFSKSEKQADSLVERVKLPSNILAQVDSLPDDTLNQAAALDSLPEIIWDNDTFNVPQMANVQYLKNWVEALKKKKKLRIGWWGDSMIEGDLITQTLREELQKKYGGKGVGFVPMVSITAGFRQTIAHSFGGWNYTSLVKTPKKTAAWGISGELMKVRVDSLNNSAWASFKNKGELPNMANVFYGSGKATIKVKVNDDNEEVLKLQDSLELNVLQLKNEAIKTLKLNVSAANKPFYGVSFESDAGIYVDNFSLRGNSGMPMFRIPQEVLSGFNSFMHYDLVVLHFGSNVIDAATTNYDWYEKPLSRVIEHYKKSFPNAVIVILGVADKSVKKDGTFFTDPGVKRVLRLQYKLAIKHGCVFFNLYEAMGGDNSMKNWVESKPSLANYDYTHFNHRGAEKIGQMIYRFLDPVEEQQANKQ